MPSTIPPERADLPNKGLKTRRVQVSATKCSNGNKLTVIFPDGEFVFHSQWLHDSRSDDGASRNAESALGRQPAETVRISSAEIDRNGTNAILNIAWQDGLTSEIPVEWLRVYAPLVAQRVDKDPQAVHEAAPRGWTVDDLNIPVVSFKDIFSSETDKQTLDSLALSILDAILSPNSSGLIKVVDLPDPIFDDELNHVNNLNTIVLKKLFGSVFVHPTRGSDKSFNVSSRSEESERRKELPNYDTTQVLLPHADHAFYENPIHVQGWYILEGESENTFVSVPAALATLKEEHPESYDQLIKTPMTLGRVSAFYGEPVFQMTVDTAIVMHPGTQDDFKRVRWHPNFIGSLLSPYEEYNKARLAHQRFQEILRRDTHQVKIDLKPGDFYIWDNFRVLHGRERVFTVPRTGVGQTVPEQVVHDKYRSLCISLLNGKLNDQWLVHLPMPQLREIVKLFQEGAYATA